MRRTAVGKHRSVRSTVGSHPGGQHLVQELTQPAVRRVDLIPRVPILSVLKCLHQNRWPHSPLTIDLGEPTDYSSRRSQDEIRLEVSCECHGRNSTRLDFSHHSAPRIPSLY